MLNADDEHSVMSLQMDFPNLTHAQVVVTSTMQTAHCIQLKQTCQAQPIYQLIQLNQTAHIPTVYS